MTILSIKLKNFGSFFGEKQFTFTKGVNIITGEKFTGKFQLMNAFVWVVTDQVVCHQHIPREQVGELIVSKKALRLSNGNPVDISVVIILEDEERKIRYSIARSFCFSDNMNGYSSSLTIKETNKRTLLTQIIDDSMRERILNYLFPIGLRKTLWIDGSTDPDSESRELINSTANISQFEQIESYVRSLLAHQVAVRGLHRFHLVNA